MWSSTAAICCAAAAFMICSGLCSTRRYCISAAGKSRGNPGIFTVLEFCISIICSWRAGRGRSACNAPRPKADGSRWNEIYELNRSIIQDYSLIYIGQVFKLPKV